MLREYDLPDLVAAVLARHPPTRVLVLGAVDEVLRALPLQTAKQQYELATAVAGARLTVETAGAGVDVVSAIVRWMSTSQ